MAAAVSQDHVADCADTLRVVEGFRKRGVRCSALHSLLPRLLAARCVNSFDGFIDVKEDLAINETATFTICCNEFLLDLHIGASAQLEHAITSVSLQHTAQDIPVWAHAPIDVLEAELLRQLRAAEVDGLFVRLNALREAQRLASVAARPAEWYTTQWELAAAAMEASTGTPPTRCCEGLRLCYYAPPGHEEGEEAYDAVVCLGGGEQAGELHLKLSLTPPLLLRQDDSAALARLMGREAPAARGEPWLQLLHESTPHAKREVLAARGPLLTVSSSTQLPVRGVQHTQTWEVSADRHVAGVRVSEIPLCVEADALPSRLRELLALLKRHATFLHLARSCMDDPLLRELPATAAAPRHGGGARLPYRLEAQLQPPSRIAIVCHLPAEPNGMPRLAELKCEMPAAEASAERASPWRGQLRSILRDHADEDAARVSALLNTSHSLPLTLAYLARRKPPDDAAAEATPAGERWAKRAREE